MDGNDNGNGRKEEGFMPYDLITSILKRLPAKSLTRFKCLSKDFKELIQNPNFTSQQLSYSADNNPLILFERIPRFPVQTPSLTLIGSDVQAHSLHFPDFLSTGDMIVASCNGLLLIRHVKSYHLSLWNPAIRQVRQVKDTLLDLHDFHWLGFGFCPILNDYKIVRLSSFRVEDEDLVIDVESIRVNCAEVYSLTTGSWKEINVANLHDYSPLSDSNINLNGAIFWAAISMESESATEFVVSFDIGREVFTVFKFPSPPPSLPTRSILAVCNSKLATFHHFVTDNFESCRIDMWLLEGTNICEAKEENWVKKFSVGPFSNLFHPLLVMRDEILCMEEYHRQVDGYGVVRAVFSLLNPYCNELKRLPAHSDYCYYHVFNYTESLVPVVDIHRG